MLEQIALCVWRICELGERRRVCLGLLFFFSFCYNRPMRYNDKGGDVRDMQQALIDQGYPLLKYGADGHLGDESWEALQRYSEDFNVKWDPEVPSAVLEHLHHKECISPTIPPQPPPSAGDIKIYDLRSEQTSPSPKSKVRGDVTVERNPKSVTGIVVHQTAVKYGLTQRQIDASDGDTELAMARRGLNVACHVIAFHDGFLSWTNELKRYIYHGNGYNRYTLGIEIDGNYPGVIGGRTWNGKPATEVTDTIVKTACEGMRLLVEEGHKLGMPIWDVYAHRQSSAARRSDPGEELWKRVVLEYAVPVLGLVPHQAKTIGEGRPVPVEWDPNGVGDY